MERFKQIVYSIPLALWNFIFPRGKGFSFLRYHYYWIISLALCGSVLVYGAGLYSGGPARIAYIDALFFTSGSSTQAGLNTVDINLLNTFQQVILYLWPMMANPITVNSFVVFLRLYWFEKKFQHIAQEARHKRVTLSKSFTKSRTKAKQQDGDVEKGVNGRKITVMLNGKKSRINNDGTLLADVKLKRRHGLGLTTANRTATDGALDGPSDNTDQHTGPAVASSLTEPRRPALKFAHTVTKSDGLGEDFLKLPRMRSDEEHIAIVERQKKGDDEVLRIPNPRDVERGLGPKRVQAGDNDDSELLSPRAGAFNLDGESQTPAADGRHPAITIEEPDRRKLQETDSEDFLDDARAAARTFDFLKPKFPLSWSRNKKNTEKEAVNAGPSQNKRRQSLQTLRTAFSHNKAEGTPYLSWEPTVGRNSVFPDLSEEQREELGGIEYRSLKTLALVLTTYFWGYSIMGVVGLLPWILNMNEWGQVVDKAGQSRVWWSFFTSQSAFMDLGFTLTPDSMNSFSTATWPLLLMSFLIVIGNTGFPIMLRFMIWLFSNLVPKDTGLYEELRFLLDHPRRCFTLLFPSTATWWLLGFLVLLNGLDVMFFIVLDLGGNGPVPLMSDGQKVLNGIFEAASTRTAGFSCVNLSQLHPAVQVSYMIMMYISVFPIAISVRRTNVYEENALGIYSKHDEEGDSKSSGEWSHVGSHARRQLSFDLPFIAIGFFILAITEGSRIMNAEDAANGFTMFAILFEVISAYGTVGMSLGYSPISASLSAEFSVVGKLVIICLMLRGRHRGLPYGLDRAILLPSEALNAKDAVAADVDGRLARQYSRMSVATHLSDTTHNQSRAVHFLAAILHPGPAMPPEPPMEVIHRRSTDPGSDAEPSLAMRITSRRTEPGVVRRSVVSHLFSPRPRTAGGHDDD
ncbi:cation transport protein-domain-containing protein [Apiosordaria backusii]|uniref:Potassium transport protein n=1 Tax=Apiosordaria backusii TaxID=314023 RepID=A0AA40K7F3_9PEZI|nr:cation transport protein-domain-containing protein [Apiosordaria backusii]